MADYTGLIRVGIEGLGQIRQLNTALERTSQLIGNLENAQVVTGQIAESATRNVNRAAQRRAQAGRDLSGATRTVANVAQRRDPDTGRFLAGGPNATARRLANAQLGLAQRDVRESDRSLREQIQNRRLIAAAEGRYARAVDRATTVLTNTQGRAQEQQLRNQQTMQGIGNASRGNYLTNLFQGRQREFARGGGGAGLSQELQQQARNVRGAWDLATAGGRENLQLMQRIATEMAGLLRQQNELNRGRAGRSIAFEAGRRGQERITDLSRMQGADPGRIRGLRSQATEVISTSNLGDIAGSREATRRMNASIGRYERELNAAAQELRNAQRRGGPASPIRGTKTMVDSPAYKAEQQRQQSNQKGFFQGDLREALGDALIGGAFPLLFGQGIGASAGGAAGGLGGGLIGGNFGFGLSLAGTAIGQAVDTTAKNLITLADAIRSPSKALDALEVSGLASSRSLEKTRLYVDQLTAVGRTYDAQSLVLQEVEKRLGSGSVRNLNALNSEQQRLQDQWSLMAGVIQAELLPALVGFTSGINSIIAAAAGIGNLPGVKEAASARNALNKNPVGRSVLGALSPFEGARQLFGKLQDRGRAVAATSAGNRQAQTPEEKLADQTSKIQESRKLADQIQSAYREAFSLQRQAYDLQRDGAMLNRDIADYSYKKEREIFDLRQQAAEKQIENNRARAQNRIEGSDLSARQTFAAATGFEQQLLTSVRESVRARKEGEADIEQSRKRLELAMARLNRDLEDYKRTNAREIEDIEQRKLSYVRSVEDYKMKVADHVLQRAREAADLMRHAMALPDMGAATATPQAARAGTATGASSGTVAFTGATGVGTGSHLDVRWADGRPITSADADRFIRVAGKLPSSFGVTSGYGPRRAPTAGASSFHKGVDFGTPTGTPVSLTGGARLVGSMTEAQSGGGGIVGIIDTPMGQMKLLHLEKVLSNSAQGQTAAQVSNIPGPKFSPVPIGATPSAAPFNAANRAARMQSFGGEKEALKILEEQNKLKQKSIELGQIEQILQNSQLPQLRQQGDVLRQQIEARQKILDLSDNAASVADIEAESRTRLLQIEKDRASALAKAQKQYGSDPAVTKQINNLADKAAGVAKDEEKQRRINLDLSNKLQNQERSRSAILQLQENLAISKAEAAALERGELQATNVELLRASTLYQFASDAEKAKLTALTAQTEELSKQNELNKQINGIRQDARFTGAGLRAGLIGAPARAYEQGLKDFKGDTTKAMAVANETKSLESQQLVWANLEKDIVSVSDAISGALTNGLVDIVSGARTIQDVGRDMLNSIAGSFADSAQQQLGNLMQRQLGGLLGGQQGPLVKMLGAGAEVAGPQALGSASMLASGQVAAFGMALQAVTAQMAFSSALGGGSALSGALGSAVSGGATNLFSKGISDVIPGIAFGGFLAEGGTAQAGKGYVVGEKEPEFFFPGVSGRVVPRSDMEKAAALRQGSEQSDPLELDYTVTERQGERMVTEEQMRRNNALLLKQAEVRTLARMRNSKEVRDFVNI
jgi:murein DD-endopeptidase MepM/ murein hydrolase activator NlpD